MGDKMSNTNLTRYTIFTIVIIALLVVIEMIIQNMENYFNISIYVCIAVIILGAVLMMKTKSNTARNLVKALGLLSVTFSMIVLLNPNTINVNTILMAVLLKIFISSTGIVLLDRFFRDIFAPPRNEYG